jgi:threonine aldolase
MDAETRARRDACHTFVHADGPVRPAELLARIPADVEPDTYGAGGVVAELEARVAALLGRPAAVYLPSGTMAQGAVLRVHASTRASRTVLWHPMCHLDAHELQAHTHLHGLVGRPVGSPDRLVTLEDLEAVAEPVAALLLELPQRDLGGRLPAWDDLLTQVAWARGRGAAVHLDGARLWEAAAGYGRSPAEVAEPFDSVYVSFYKGVGALAGCCVAGDDALVASVREWRTRLGGTLYGLWPGAATALALLPERLEQMPARLEHARAVAAALEDVPGVRVSPPVPQTPMMHLVLETTPEAFEAASRRLAEEEGVWTWGTAVPTADPGAVRVELAVGTATLDLDPERVAGLVAVLAGS